MVCGLLQVWMGKEVRVRWETGVGEEEVLGWWGGHFVVKWGIRVRSKAAGAEAKVSARRLARVVSYWRR